MTGETRNDAKLTTAEIAKYKLSAPRPVLYANGCFMTAGQHKGIMLLTLLKNSADTESFPIS